MLTRPGPFYIFEIAHAVARLPGRAEVDEPEARRLGDDMAEWWCRGEFRECEAVVNAGDPPRQRPEMMEENRHSCPEWRLSHSEWYATVMLTAPALQRYLEGCGFAGGQRVLREWGFTPADTPSGPEPVQLAAKAASQGEAPSDPSPQPTSKPATGQRGRKSGSGEIGDDVWLCEMLRLLGGVNPPASINAAATKVVETEEVEFSGTAQSAARRLARKFNLKFGAEPPSGKNWSDVLGELQSKCRRNSRAI